MRVSGSRIVNNGIDKDLCRKVFQTWFFYFLITLYNLVMLKNIKNALLLIANLIIVVNGVVIFDGHSQLDNLLQKSLRYHHHRENYIQSLREGVIATGLTLKKA